MDPLELATTDDLIDELKRRYPVGFVCAGTREKDGDEDDGEHEFIATYGGLITASIGCTVRLLDMLRREARVRK